MPISAYLLLDERLKDDVGILSEDLFADLFPDNIRLQGTPTNDCFQRKRPADGRLHLDLEDLEDRSRSTVRYVAITPWTPASLVSTTSLPWTVLPVKAGSKGEGATQRPHSSLVFPSTSPALQTFFQALQALSPGRSLPRKDAPIEIRVLDVVPLGLDTVFVSVDTEALKKLDEVQAKFGGGFGYAQSPNARKLAPPSPAGSPRRSKSREDMKALQSTWRKAVRDALRAPKLVHSGDLVALPLPSHPITYVPPPPAKIISCEPVPQGLLLPSTRIVLVHSLKHSKAGHTAMPTLTNGIPEEDEDTSNEQFYSATEERIASDVPSPPSESEAPTADNLESDTSATDNDDLSDDSEDAFSLSTAMLPAQTTGVLSAYTSATPRPGMPQTNGIGTPGSVYSSFTASTARPNKGKLFKARGLLQRIPDELLHPKPGNDDDEESRVFVDTSTLVKIGCFSGDWVKLEVHSEQSSHDLVPWTMSVFGEESEDPTRWRAVKIFALPDNISKKGPRLPTHKAMMLQPSFLDLMRPTSLPNAYASPILLANLDDPTLVRISPLAFAPDAPPSSSSSIQRGKIKSSSMPPLAKEVTLLKISTPLSTDRSLQPSLFSSLKAYFERKRRVVQIGDLIGIAVDTRLGRSVFNGSAGEDTADNEILSGRKTNTTVSGSTREHKQEQGIAWFKVGHVVPSKIDDHDDPSVWGEAVCVDAANAKMVMEGSEQSKVPSTTQNLWQYYLELKRPPVSAGSTIAREFGILEPPAPFTSALRRRLRELVSASTILQAIHMGLPPLAILLTSTQRLIGKAFVAERACEDLGLHVFMIDAFDILTEVGAGGGDVKTEALFKVRAERAMSCGAQYTALLIKHIEALNADRMVTAFKEVLNDSRIIIATTTEVDKIPDGIRGLFTHELEMTAPDEKEREGILRSLVEGNGVRIAPDVDLASVAVKTAALVAGDLVDVVDRAVIAKQTRLEALADAATKHDSNGLNVTVRDIEVAGGSSAISLTRADFNAAVDAARKNFADSIGAPKIPNVSWADVGGLTHVKDAVMETIQLPLVRPELFAKGMKKRSGILFYGPPGTGKTLLAKAIATEFSLNFFSVKGPELLNMYIGESEANVRRVFQRARDARPCVVFFDELDSVAPKRGNQGDSGGVMDRIVSQLLAELDGMSDGKEGAGGVFVIGATNRPDLLDNALLRPGRFDKMLYLGVSDTHDKQLTILEALTRKFTLHPDLSLSRIAESLPFTYTGADLYALCSDAMLKAITRQARRVDAKVTGHNASLPHGSQPISIAHFFDHLAIPEDVAVMVEEEDFVQAHRELVPSVSAEELQHYERVRHAFEGQGNAQKTIEADDYQDLKHTEARQHQKHQQRKQLPLHNQSPPSIKHRRPSMAKGKGVVATVHGGVRPRTNSVGGNVHSEEENTNEDEYVIRTEHLGVNGRHKALANSVAGNGNGSVFSSRIGKGKGRISSNGSEVASIYAPSTYAVSAFGDATEGDEDMYS